MILLIVNPSLGANVQASEETLEYPGWALAVLSLLIILAMLPIPLGFIHATLQSRAGSRAGGGAGDPPIGFQAISTNDEDDKCETPKTDVMDVAQTPL